MRLLVLTRKQMRVLEGRPHMSMELDRAGMRMRGGLRERETRSNPGGYKKKEYSGRAGAAVLPPARRCVRSRSCPAGWSVGVRPSSLGCRNQTKKEGC